LFNTGKRHLLALGQKLVVSGAAAHSLSNAGVIGDFVLYSVGTTMFNPTTYLIPRKDGCPTFSTRLDVGQNQMIIFR
jgi:hypothetical protein